jgi:hypothetical protein
MNPLLEGALLGSVIALVLMPVIYWSIRGRDHPFDRIVLTQLSGKGINLEKQREVEFGLFVRTEPSAKHIAERLTSEGFTVRYESGKVKVRVRRTAPATTQEGFLVFAAKSVNLYGDTLRTVRKQFSAMAEKENGAYLGWQALDLSP